MKRYILMALCIMTLASCGAGGGSAPPDSTIVLNPADMSVIDSSPQPAWHEEQFTVVLKDADSNPVPNAKVFISFIWAVPDIAGVVQLLDTHSKPHDSPMEVETDSHGVYNFIFRFQSGGGLKYTGNVEARSGDAFASTTVSVSPE